MSWASASRSSRFTPTSATSTSRVSTSATNRPAGRICSISAGVLSSITGRAYGAAKLSKDAGMNHVELWTSAPFLGEVREWVADELATRAVRLTGDWEQPHARPWSSAIRFETTDGPGWVKVNGPGTSHEPALVRLIDQRMPGVVPEVLAVHPTSKWALSRDGGPTLRSIGPPEQLWTAWEGLVARYADLQLRLADDRDVVLGTGVREVSPATVPGLARALLDDLAAMSVDAGGLNREQVERLTDVLPALDDWCVELAASEVPDSVQHDDLHSNNVCWTGSVETARIIDWGDATWGSPLGTMLATMNSIAFHAGVLVEGRSIDDPRVLRVRDAYLEPFTLYAPRADLVRYVEMARRIGCVAKALSYETALEETSLSVHAEYEFPVRGWFLELLEEWVR